MVNTLPPGLFIFAEQHDFCCGKRALTTPAASELLFEIAQGVPVQQRDLTAPERNKAVLGKALEHARHGLARRADVLGNLLVCHADGGGAGALRLIQEKTSEPPVEPLE